MWHVLPWLERSFTLHTSRKDEHHFFVLWPSDAHAKILLPRHNCQLHHICLSQFFCSLGSTCLSHPLRFTLLIPNSSPPTKTKKMKTVGHCGLVFRLVTYHSRRSQYQNHWGTALHTRLMPPRYQDCALGVSHLCSGHAQKIDSWSSTVSLYKGCRHDGHPKIQPLGSWTVKSSLAFPAEGYIFLDPIKYGHSSQWRYDHTLNDRKISYWYLCIFWTSSFITVIFLSCHLRYLVPGTTIIIYWWSCRPWSWWSLGHAKQLRMTGHRQGCRAAIEMALGPRP